MRRSQQYLEEPEEQSSPPRQYPSVHSGYSAFTHTLTTPEDWRRLPSHSEMGPIRDSPHHTTSSPGSSFMPPQSPMQASQPMRSTTLPSPSSLTFPNAPILPAISPPSVAGLTSVQSTHIQELQHQISVKTLAFQTLQREYDTLLQKLEQQRTKCATLEKNIEVSDVEVSNLTDEKDRLHMQVATLEVHVEDLQASRDEARRQLVANGAQYARIMDMSNKLQGQGAEDKKKWEADRVELEQRIRLLEEAMVTGTPQAPVEREDLSHTNPPAPFVVHPHGPPTSSGSQSETIYLLRAEVTRLRSQTQTLETALQTIRKEGISIQKAALEMVDSSGRLESVMQDTLWTSE